MVGIDKLTLTTREFKLMDCNEYTPHYTKPPGSEIIETHKRYQDSTGLIQSSINHKGLVIQINPSAIIRTIKGEPINYLATTKEDIETATELTLTHIESIGVRLPEQSLMDITRIDYAKDMETDHPAMEYFPALAILGGKRLKPRNEPTTYYFANKQRQFCMYDKGLEVYDKTNGNKQLKGNITRFECRYLKTKEVQKTCNLRNLKEFMATTPEQWQHFYSTQLKEQVFRTDNNEPIPITLTMKQQQRIVDYFGGNRNFEQIIMKSALLEYYGTRERMIQHLKHIGMKRSGIGKKLRQCETALKQKGIIDSYRNKETTATMLNELITKFTNVA